MRLFIVLVVAILSGSVIAGPDPFAETRHCGEPKRDANGRIIRRADVLAAFRNLYACPATNKHSGSCKGWAIDHVIPLAVGGCDAVRNLQWMPNKIKSCPGSVCKDRWEREVYKK